MAPEIFTEGIIEARPSLDIWCIGCILYAMICGDLPFLGKTINEITSKIKTGSFAFPIEVKISKHCKDLIRTML